jgi:O-antigen/teichoic acid export membrane protein
MLLLACQFVLASVGSVNFALLQRTFRYRELAVTDLAGVALTFAFGYLFMAVFHWGVYGLLGAMVVATAVTSGLNLLFMPWLPSFVFCRDSLRRHLSPPYSPYRPEKA